LDSINKKIKLLSNHGRFKDCSEASLQDIVQNTYLKKYKKGEILLTGDSTIHKISILVSKGRLKIFTLNPSMSNEYTVYVLQDGDIFNVITYLDGHKDNLTAQALDDIEILHCNIDIAREWIYKHDAFNKNLLLYLSGRLKTLQENSISKTFFNIEIRLAHLILQNISQSSSEADLINNLSNKEIAKIIGTTRAVINRNLQLLKKKGIIPLEYKQILVENKDKLIELLENYTDYVESAT